MYLVLIHDIQWFVHQLHCWKLWDVQDISSTNDAFAAIKSDGTIVAWGDGRNGGDSSAVQDTGFEMEATQLVPLCIPCEIDLEDLYCFVLFCPKYQISFGTLSGGLHFVMSYSAFWRSFSGNDNLMNFNSVGHASAYSPFQAQAFQIRSIQLGANLRKSFLRIILKSP